MSNAKSKQLRDKIEASRTRHRKRERSELAERASDARDRLTSIARKHPLLLIAGGLAVGVAVSALFPKSPTRKIGKSAFGIAATIAELGFAYSRQALETAGETAEGAARTGKSKLADIKGSLARKRREITGKVTKESD